MTRADLTPGQQATQASHAAFSLSVEAPDRVREWHDASNNLVLLAVPDEDCLLDLHRSLYDEGFLVVPMFEPDLGGALTAVAAAAAAGLSERLSDLPLALREEVSV